MDESVACDSKSFFSEKDEVLSILQSLPAASAVELEDRFERVKRILDRYQEQPQLIGPHVEEIVTPLNAYLLNNVDSKVNSPLLHATCKILVVLCKVRGFKQCAKYLPHEVYHLEPCVAFLKLQDPRQYNMWEIQYVLLLWLATLCLIPFDLASLDSSDSSVKLVTDLIETAKIYLGSSGPSREAAAMCIASLLTRPDMQSIYLHEYLTWSIDVFGKFNEVRDQQLQFLYLGSLHSLTQIFKRGHRDKLLSFVELVLASSLSLCEAAEQVMERKFLTKLLQRLGMTLLPVREASWRYQRGKRTLNLLALNDEKSVAKETTVTNQNADADDFEVSPLLEDIIDKLLQFLGDKDTVVRWSAAKGIGRIAMRLPKLFGDEIVAAIIGMFDDEEDDSRWHGGCLALAELTRRGLLLPENLCNIVPLVARALHHDVLKGQHGIGSHVRDAASYVCWSFSRAYAPIIMRPYVQELSTSMLTAILFDREINCRRAAAAAFQENVGRQGHENFPNGIDIITIADFFSVGNRTACYLELAPQIACLVPSILPSFIDHLTQRKLSHWDSDIRELASKAIARLILVDKNGFDYNELVNSFVVGASNVSLSIRHGSMLGLARVILTLSVKGEILSEVTKKNVECLAVEMEKRRLFRGRGGEMVRESACILMESIAYSKLSDSTKFHVSVVEFLNDQLRQPHLCVQLAAQNALRQCLFAFFGDRSKGEPSERLQKLTILKYVDGLNSEQNVAATRGYGMALGALCSRFLLSSQSILVRVLTTLARFSESTMKVGGEYDAETCKICIESAIEIFEKINRQIDFDNTLAETILRIFLKGCEDYNVDKRGDTGSWSRIASLRSLERFTMVACESARQNEKCDYYECCYGVFVSSGNQSPFSVMFPEKSIGWKASNDFKWVTTDAKSVNQPPIILLHAIKINISTVSISISDDLVQLAYSAILKQLAEKLDNVREIAGEALVGVNKNRMHESTELDEFIASLLKATFSKHTILDWSRPDHSFPFVCNSLKNDALIRPVLEGIIVSVGGLTESISREATSAVVEFASNPENAPSSVKFIQSMLVIYEERLKDDRVIIPLLKSIDIIFRKGVLNCVPSEVKEEWDLHLYTLLRNQLRSSTNIPKIMISMDLVVMLVTSSSSGDTSKESLELLVNMLGHKYPRIRKYVSEQLYLVLIGSPAFQDKDLSLPLDILLTTMWETCSKEDLVQSKNLLCDHLNVQCYVSKDSGSRKISVKEDELDSYESLVRDAGY